MDPDPYGQGSGQRERKQVRTQRTITSREGIMIVAESNLGDHWWILT